MSDETPAEVTWPMSAAEARDIARAQANLAQVQAQFQAVASAFAKREGVPEGSKVKFDIERLVWIKEG